MKILFEKKFLKDIEGVNDKRIKQQLKPLFLKWRKLNTREIYIT